MQESKINTWQHANDSEKALPKPAGHELN